MTLAFCNGLMYYKGISIKKELKIQNAFPKSNFGKALSFIFFWLVNKMLFQPGFKGKTI